MDTRLTVATAARWRVWRLIAALGACAAVASVGISACADEGVAPLTSSAAGVPANHGPHSALGLDNIGEFHNSFLDFAFPRMRAAVAQGRNQAQLCAVIAQAMREFVVVRRIGVDPGLIRDDVAGGDCVAQTDRVRAGGPGQPRLALATDDVPVGELDIIVSELAYVSAENLPTSTIASVANDKVAYARAHLPLEEADIVAATAEIAVSSSIYWDENYAYQEQILLEEAGLTTALARVGRESPRLSAAPLQGLKGLLAPPERRSDDWLTDIENSSWYPKARKVAVADIGGAVRGGLSGWRGGWQGIVAGAAIEGGAASAGGLIREVFKPWSK